jgi:hypothetical protein
MRRARTGSTTWWVSVSPRFAAGRVVWDYDEVMWGEQPCHYCFGRRMVELLLDGTPVCVPCADLIFDRIVAVSMLPRMRELLPPLWER